MIYTSYLEFVLIKAGAVGSDWGPIADMIEQYSVHSVIFILQR